MTKPLSQKQIITLAADAKKAFDACDPATLEELREDIARRREAEGDPFACAALVKKTLLFDTWRRREIARATQSYKRVPAESFGDLSNTDFVRVRAHFIRFFDAIAAERVLARDEANRAGWLRDKIAQTCRAVGWMRYPEYPDGICRDQYKRGLDAASSEELRRILITLRTRAKQKKST